MKKLLADKGKVYTNGTTYGAEICLPDTEDETKWYQVDESKVPSQDEATEADKDAALRSFGVEV